MRHSFPARRRRRYLLVAAVVLPLSVATSVATWIGVGPIAPGSASPLRYEVENLPRVASAGDAVTTMPAADCDGATCLAFAADAVGDSLTVTVDLPQAGSYRVGVAVKTRQNRGTYRLAVREGTGAFVDRGSDLDLYTSDVQFRTLPVGTVTFATAGTKDLRLTVTGRNAASSGYAMGLDSILFEYTAPAGFAHPGIVVSGPQLDAVKAKVAAKQEPWASAFTALKASRFSKPTWTPRARAVVACGGHNVINEGCTDETDDAQAAYAHALLWRLTGDQAHAAKAIEILDAWSAVLTEHRFDEKTYVNGHLQAAWAGEIFTKAAEVVRYGGSGWKAERISRFEGMLKNAFLPMVKDGWKGGGANGQLSMAEATMNIGVFTNDRAVFDEGLGDWRRQVVSAVYHTSDGAKPIPPPDTIIKASGIDKYWGSPASYPSGLQGETCRDLGHMAMGFAALLNAAETASIQGVDLYGEQRNRIIAGMEYNSRFVNDRSASGWVCPAAPKDGGVANWRIWELGYRHYAVQGGASLPETRKLIKANRPSGSGLHSSWETLTHATGVL